MLDRILNFIKKFIPQKPLKKILPFYHFLLAKLSALIYFYPSEKMIIIGVTGTSGKSSTCYFIAQMLEAVGLKVGLTSTTIFKIGSQEWLNDKKMTMLGRFQTQKLLRQMVSADCQVAIVETPSQGIEQFRHIDINYDILVFTNLYTEHIEAHGGFENYKKAKGKLFQYLSQTKRKNIKKTIIVNADDEHAEYFLNFEADQKITFNGQKKYEAILLGKYNNYNINAAAEVAKILNVPEEKIAETVKNLKPLPGRLEFIPNNRNIKIIVDYAFEPKALEKLYKTIKELPHQKIIHVLGSAGGGRDKTRRPIMGEIAAKNADIVIVTNEDPYDEDPQTIIDEVATGAVTQASEQNYFVTPTFRSENLYKILDRREAIRKALELAQENDLVLITGKGAEQAICIDNGKKNPWDDRKVVKEELEKIQKIKNL